jgi:hypothetical protein
MIGIVTKHIPCLQVCKHVLLLITVVVDCVKDNLWWDCVAVFQRRNAGRFNWATASSSLHDDEDKSHVKMLQAKYPTAMPYFFTQDPDYITVKERVAKHTVDGSEAEGVATIGIAVETLKVAEYLTPLLQEQLK